MAIDYLLSEKARYNHTHNRIYIHDLDNYVVGCHNCLTIPFDDLLAQGFNTRQTDVRPAGSVNTAFQLVAVIFQLQSLQQFGGVSATHLDWTMVPYVRKSFKKHYLTALKYIEKKPLVSGAIDDNPHFALSTIETDRPGNSYTYVTLEELFKTADVITFHTPAVASSFHMVNAETIPTMKDGVIIINTARGSIIDTPVFIDALDSGKIGGAALDVIENELGIFYGDYKYKVIGHREMSILKDYPNVLMLPHMAFYTENAISDMVEHSICHIIEGKSII